MTTTTCAKCHAQYQPRELQVPDLWCPTCEPLTAEEVESIEPDTWIVAGHGADADFGRVLMVDGEQWVAWDSGVRTRLASAAGVEVCSDRGAARDASQIRAEIEA